MRAGAPSPVRFTSWLCWRISFKGRAVLAGIESALAEQETNAVIDTFLAACLRQTLAGGPCPQWPAALGTQTACAPDHELVGLFAARLECHGIALLLAEQPAAFSMWPAPMAEIARALAHRTALEAQLQNPRIAAAIRTLAKADVPCLVLKGAAISHLCYALPAARPRGDTDLLIAPDNLSAARAALQAGGWRRTVAPEIHHSQECWSMNCGAGMTHTIDLHWQISNHATLRQALPAQALWNSRIALPRLCAEALCPSRELLLVHGAINQQWHKSRGFHLGDDLVRGTDRLIWIVDTYLLCSSFGDKEWNALVTYCQNHGLGDVVSAALCDAAETAGLILPAGVLQKLGPAGERSALFDYLRKPDGLSVLRADFAASQSAVEKARLLKTAVAPSRSQLLGRYPGADRWPTLALHARRYADALLKMLPHRAPRAAKERR